MDTSVSEESYLIGIVAFRSKDTAGAIFTVVMCFSSIAFARFPLERCIYAVRLMSAELSNRYQILHEDKETIPFE
jgi:hypothetical protein